jgi:hypothetical protein
MNGILGPKIGQFLYQRQGRTNQWEWKSVGMNRAEPVATAVRFKKDEQGNENT